MLTLKPPTRRKQVCFVSKEAQLLPRRTILPSKKAWSGNCNYKCNVMWQTEISDHFSTWVVL